MEYQLNEAAFTYAVQLALQGSVEHGGMPPVDNYFRTSIMGEDGEDIDSWRRVHLAVAGDDLAMPIIFKYGEDAQPMLSVGALQRARHQAGMLGLSEIFNRADQLLSLAIGQQTYYQAEGEVTFTADGSGFWVEIFKAGTWTASNGFEKTYTTDDLHAVVAAFKALEGDLNVPLRAGDHTATTASDSKMAYGWVSDLKVEGDVLLGYFDHVPDDMKTAMREKRYRAKSAGFWFDWKYEGETYPIVLNHVAILGAIQPAVKGLKDLDALMGDGKTVQSFTFAEEGNEMELKEALEKVESLKADLSAKDEELTSVKTENEQLKAAAAEFAERELKTKVAGIVEKSVAEGRCLPAHKDAELSMGLALAKSADFSEDGDVGAFGDWEKRLVEGDKIVDFSEKATSGGDDKSDDPEAQRAEYRELARKAKND